MYLVSRAFTPGPLSWRALHEKAARFYCADGLHETMTNARTLYLPLGRA